jgi:hypothetical protein
MINDAGKHQVNATHGVGKPKVWFMAIADWVGMKSTFRINERLMKALAE